MKVYTPIEAEEKYKQLRSELLRFREKAALAGKQKDKEERTYFKNQAYVCQEKMNMLIYMFNLTFEL